MLRRYQVPFLVIICVLSLVAGGAGASSLVPALANPGFEEVAQGNAAPGWGWYSRAAASLSSETADPHSGSRCLLFSNASPQAPEVYARLFQCFGVSANTRYQLSVWVRGEEVSEGLHFTDWATYTLNIPSGTYGWQRITAMVDTTDGQTQLNLGINVTNKCKALAIDDITLRPVGTPLKGIGIDGSVVVPGQVNGDNKPASLNVSLFSSLPDGAKLVAAIKSGQDVLLDRSQALKPGDNTIDWQWNTGAKPYKKLVCSVRVLDAGGKVVALTSSKIGKLSPSAILADIAHTEERLKEFDSLAAKCRARRIPLDYPMVTRTMLAQFIPLTRDDVKNGEERRAYYAVKDFKRSTEEAIAELKAYLANPEFAPIARRYQTGKVDIEGLSLVGTRKDSTGAESRGPLFFCGYGHFMQVRSDMPKWPGYGVNIIQHGEFGPSAVFPEEGKVDLSAVKTLIKALDDAAKNNVRVDFLISPHFFPQWYLTKYPHLMQGGGGFLGYTVDAPEAQELIERYLRLVIPMVKDKPALHSLCLSNEPLFDRGAGAHNTRPMWESYLKRIHGDVATLNKLYHSDYAGFENVPIPGNGSYGDPPFYDWCVFNQERFAGWHKWMADIIHEIAPEVPVHAKAMWIPISWRQAVSLGEDPELFAQLSDMNGNDCSIQPGGGDSGISWGEQNMFYDLQRSMAKKPIFNSENHLQPDGSSSYVAPEHYRAALWQGAIHGQGSTTIWVWERMVPEHAWSHSFYGNVMDRPGCAVAVGTTCLDLNRFSGQVTALQNARAPVAVLYSMASYARSDVYLGAIARAYTALNFCGVKIDFVSEKQLAAGKGAQYKMIVLPDATNVLDSIFDAITKLPASTRVVLIGDSLAMDPYNNKRSDDILAGLHSRSLRFAANADPKDVLWPSFLDELGRLGGLPEFAAVDTATGKPVWGLEWLTAKFGGNTIINMVDLRSKPMNVKIVSGGKTVAARDLLSLGGAERVKVLKPITPMLAEVKR